MQDCLSFKDTVYIRQYGMEYKITKCGNRSFRIMFHDDVRKQWNPVVEVFNSLEECISFVRTWIPSDKLLSMCRS